MHPDSSLTDALGYLVILPSDPPRAPLKPVKEIRVLDPATGTMHFGLFAFDLFVLMYREELKNAGKQGWPPRASVEKEEDIPAAIVANNLFGIDIDLRAVQLAALALYVRAKATNKGAVLTDSNLACADVAVLRGQHLANIAREIGLPHGITRDLLQKFCESVTEAGMMGTLVRLEEHFHNIEAERLRKAIDDYVVAKSKQDIDESYFGNETNKGLRLLDMLSRRYDVVFTNPPYISNRKMNANMTRFMKAEYPNAKGDLYAAFIQRCLELTSDSGRTGMLTMHSFMFISSYEKLRDLITNTAGIETVAHYGPGLFGVGNPGTLQTTAFVLRRESFQSTRQDSWGVYLRLVKEPDAEAKTRAFETAMARRKSGDTDPNLYEYRQGDFAAIPGSPWVYWITPSIRNIFSSLPNLESIAKPCVGINTNDNFRFVRCWWEVGAGCLRRDCLNREEAEESGFRWFPYMKGGGFKRWWGKQELVVNWRKDGDEIKALAVIRNDGQHWSRYVRSIKQMFRRGVTYSYLTTAKFSARLSPGGFAFDVGGSSVFPNDVELILALLNSEFAYFALKLINPTINFQVGDLARLPVPQRSSTTLREMVRTAVTLARLDSEESEATFDFVAPPAWPGGIGCVTTRHRDLATVEGQIEEEVYRLYEISPSDRRAIEVELGATVDVAELDGEIGDESKSAEMAAESDATMPFSNQELAQQWFSYAVGVALGRFKPGAGNGIGCGTFSTEIANRLRRLSDKGSLMVLEEGHPDDLAARTAEILTTIHGDAELVRIVREATQSQEDLRQAIETYLLGPFFKDHVRRYRKRPIFWLFQSPEQHYSVYLFHEHATDQTLALLQGKRYLGGRIHNLENELKDAKRKESASSGRDKVIWAKNARSTC